MRAPFVLVPQFFGSLVFERASSRYLPFDEEATSLLAALASGGLGAALAEAGSAERRAAIGAFAEAFAARGFFDAAGRFLGELRPRPDDLPADHLLGPLATHVEIIAACNLSCRHCFAAPLPRRGEPLSLRELDALFAELSALGAFRLGLTGGEPLARRDVLEVVDAAVHHGLHPCLTTNALLLDEPLARGLAARPLAWLNVSLDGATAASNDEIRGAGTFERVLEKLALLRAAGARFTLAFTITSRSAAEAEACARLARDVGAHTAVFRPAYPAGAALHDRALLPTFEAYAGALAALARDPGPDADLRAGEPFSPTARAPAQARVAPARSCGAGELAASVSVDGQVSPCSFLGPSFGAGSVRERSFRSLWRDGDAFAALRARSRAVFSPGRFAGGCRARSLALAGDVDAADPWQLAHEGLTPARPPGRTLEVLR